MPNIGPFEIVLLLVVGLLFFGSKRLPEMAKSFGQAIQEFKNVGKQVQKDVETALKEEPPESTEKPPKQTSAS
ncbi:MAG: twin-arginine translocase TatA/TatE family subunit [Candidatus Poribacteria bacterium]|nr:twin-arginine translocase TatA/TatE family subunit [Candidatus Poribacteria bacterium]